MMKLKIIKQLKKLTTFEKIFLVFLIFAQAFYFYRYTFSFGSNFSPPNYVLTPAWIQLTKYLLAAIFFSALSYTLFKTYSFKKIKIELLNKKIFFLIAILFFYIVISLFKFGFKPDSFGLTQTTKMLFVIPFVFFIPFIVKEKNFLHLLKMFLIGSLMFHLFFEAIEVAAFFAFRRLPGLAFSGWLPRYGGGWDDANAFGSFVVLLLLVFFVWKTTKNRLVYFIIFLLTLMLLLTYSVTAFLGFVITVTMLFFLKKLPLKRILVSIVTIIGFGLVHFCAGLLNLLITAKILSSSGHISSVPNYSLTSHSVVIQKSMLVKLGEFIFGYLKTPVFHENLYYQIFLNYGLVAEIILIGIIVLTIVKSYKNYLSASGSEYKNLYLIAFIYITSFSVMNIGVPFFEVFPVNLFAWCLIGIVWTLPTNKSKIEKISAWLPFKIPILKNLK